MASPSFLIFSCSLSGRDDFVLFGSLDGNGGIHKFFMRYSNFALNLNSQTLDGNPADGSYKAVP